MAVGTFLHCVRISSLRVCIGGINTTSQDKNNAFGQWIMQLLIEVTSCITV